MVIAGKICLEKCSQVFRQKQKLNGMLKTISHVRHYLCYGIFYVKISFIGSNTMTWVIHESATQTTAIKWFLLSYLLNANC